MSELGVREKARWIHRLGRLLDQRRGPGQTLVMSRFEFGGN